MTSPGWTRAPVDPARVLDLLGARPVRLAWTAETGSTNDDLAAGPAAPAGVLVALTAELQTSGRGRSGRGWTCPSGAGLMVSVRAAVPEVPPGRRSWIGAIAGLALTRAVAASTGLTATLKWPNDLLLDGRKSAGILAEAVGDDVVVGCGLNVSLESDELPRPDAGSLLLAGAAPVDRAALLADLLSELSELVAAWRQAAGDVDAAGIRPAYLAACATLGRTVRVELPGDRVASGTAVDVDPAGSIVLRTAAGERRFAVGDVVHLR